MPAMNSDWNENPPLTINYGLVHKKVIITSDRIRTASREDSSAISRLSIRLLVICSILGFLHVPDLTQLGTSTGIKIAKNHQRLHHFGARIPSLVNRA